MIPEKIPMRREEDFHTHYLGHFEASKIFVGFPFFAEPYQKRPIAVLHFFDADGNHSYSQIWESEKMFMVKKALEDKVKRLNNMKFGDVAVKPFSVELNGLKFGLIVEQKVQRVNYEPYGLSFRAPWNGLYDT